MTSLLGKERRPYDLYLPMRMETPRRYTTLHLQTRHHSTFTYLFNHNPLTRYLRQSPLSLKARMDISSRQAVCVNGGEKKSDRLGLTF